MLTTPRFDVLPYMSEVRKLKRREQNLFIDWMKHKITWFSHQVLDGLFKMLGDPAANVRDVTETVLGQFLLGVKKSPHVVESVSTTSFPRIR